MLVRPVSDEQIARIEVHEVVRKDERNVRLRPGAHQLILFAESKNVISQNIFAPVMLMKSSALTPVDDVALKNNSAAPFIRVKAPAAVRERVDVVNEIIADHRAGLRAECVDRAHIAEPKLADIVQMIVLDQIGATGR